MKDLLQMACKIADGNNCDHAVAVDFTEQGGGYYMKVASTRPPLIELARYFERHGADIYLADKLSGTWEAY